MVEVLQKYRRILIALILVALIILTILLVIVANKKTEKIPLRGVFVKNVKVIEMVREAKV
jgi:hypothetical protein